MTVAPLTYQQHALALLRSPTPLTAMRGGNPVTLRRAVQYLVAAAEHVMSAPQVLPEGNLPAQLRHLNKCILDIGGEDPTLFREAANLEAYLEIVRILQASDDPQGMARRVADAYSQYHRF